MNITKIADYVESLTGHDLNGDEGTLYGDAGNAVGKVVVCWMATAEALEFAGRIDADWVIGHEALFFPYPFRGAGPPEGWESWPVNRGRIDLLDRYNLGFMRIHGSADEICIFDEFANVLGLGDPAFEKNLVKVYDIAPTPLADLIIRVKSRMGMDSVRVCGTGKMDRSVSRVGLPWGGLGLFVNVRYQQSLVELGCDVFVAGETDNYGMRFSDESGIPMIETSHEVSENPGLKVFTAILRKQFPKTQFEFFENEVCWSAR